MTAFLVAHFKTLDTPNQDAKLTEYREGFMATLGKFGGEIVLRGAVVDVPLGEHDFEGSVVVQFADEGKMKGWYESEEYQTLVPLREEIAEVTLIFCVG